MEILKNVGVAISTTKKRKSHWEKLKANHKEFTKPEIENYHFDFRVDEEMKGVAFSKNASLKYLYDKGCEYFFLFDDDVWLKRTGFFHWVYRVHKASNIHHFIYLNQDIHKATNEQKVGNHTILNSSLGSGCYMFITRTALEKVGGYDLDLKGYGFNHVDYSNRLHYMMGRQPHEYTTIKDMNLFLHCTDFDGGIKGVRKINTLTEKQKKAQIEINNPIFKEKAKNLNRYCPL